MKKCDGACESHVGEVVTVHVETVSGYDWGEFDYCESAIEEDRRRGLIVTPSNKASTRLETGAANADSESSPAVSSG